MIKDQEKLIRMIKEGRTCNDISKELNISNKQLYNKLLHLKNSGLIFNKNYYSNGQITYKIDSSLSNVTNSEELLTNNLLSLHDETSIKTLIISDLHYGNKLERPDLVDDAFNYCVKNNIHIIFCVGDMIDCLFKRCKSEYDTVEKQIKHFLKDYPFDKDILTFAVAGNHDIYGYYDDSRSIIEATKNYRQDIIIGGYQRTSINIKNDTIDLFHHIDNLFNKRSDSIISLHGHLHKYKAEMTSKNKLAIIVPSLSDVNQTLPTALEMTMNFKKGYIETVDLKQIYFIYKDMILSEASYNLLKNRNVVAKSICNEINKGREERVKVYGLSQR